MHEPRRWSARRSAWRTLVGVAACLVVAAALPGRAAAAPPTWPANPNWQSLVPAPTSDSVRAATVTRTSGSVTNAGGLAGQGSGATVLTTSATNSPATVILDFGKEVGGTPFATVSAFSGSSVTLRIATSEALPYLTASNGVYNNDNGSPVTFAVNGARTYTGALRGGFRFAAVQLTTPGSVTLTGAGVNFKAYRATADRYQGYFISSDDQLNRMWYAGAYTAQMDMVPTGVASCFTVPVIFDGAKRDRAIWSGDLMITNPVAQLSLGSNSVRVREGLDQQHLQPAELQRPADERGRVPRLRRIRLRDDLFGLLGDHRGPVLPLHQRHRLHHRAADEAGGRGRPTTPPGSTPTAWSSPTTTTTGRPPRAARSPSTASPTTNCCRT